jgi:hypothetical protein
MAREITSITHSDDPISDLHAEVHESLRILRNIQDLMTELGPLVEAWRRTGGGSVGMLRARKAFRDGGTGRK